MDTNTPVLTRLLDILWGQYKKRVVYAAQYQDMVERQGGRVQNDHIALRTFNTQTGQQPAGVAAIARILEPLGYQKKDQYIFADKHLTAWHWEHATHPDHPKIFVSQLEVDRLTPATAAMIDACVANAPDLLTATDLESLHNIGRGQSIDPAQAAKLAANLAAFFVRPWSPPSREVVEAVNVESQYAAWTLLHGNSVNHFTAYINRQNVAAWPDLETTVNALRAAGLPMKDELEGEKGSKLRQSSTKASTEDCDIIEKNGSRGKMSWSYAYYELAERGMVTGADGKPLLFQGFLGAQATNLFEMTKRD